MFLSGIFSKHKNSKEYYFGLFLKGDQAVGMVLEVSDRNLIILDQDSCNYSNGWENIVEDIDDLIFKLESKTKKHLKKSIFFTYSYFIDETTHEIKQPYKDIVRNLLKKLELEPLGYIECFEAVASYLGRRDSIPLNAILIELDKKNVDVCVYKGGKRIFSRNSSRTNDLIEDLTAIFESLKGQVLPSRVILYDSSNMHDESTKIIAHKWDEDIFIQPPRVEVVKEEKLYKELADVFVQQLFDDGNHSDATMPKPNITPEVAATPDPDEYVRDTTSDDGEPEAATAAPAGVMGFVIGKDIGENLRSEPIQEYEEGDDEEEEAADIVTPPEEDLRLSPVSTPSRKRPAFTFPSFKMPAGPSRGVMKYAWIVGIILIVSSLITIEYYFHKATLTLMLPSHSLAKKFDFEVTVGADDGSGLAVKTSTYSATFSEAQDTSGKRDLGEKARGEVTLHNFTDGERTVSKGTVLSAAGKSFVLDQDVKVASASENLVDGGFVKQPGKSKGPVVASVLGPDSNLAKGQRFSVGDLPSSSFFAVNETAFSGGTRKSVQTVSKDDIEKLKKAVIEKAKKDSVEGIRKSLSGNDRLIDQLTNPVISSSKTNKEIGEETDSVTLTAEVNVQYYYYNADSLKKTLADELKKDAPSGSNILIDQLKVTMRDVSKKGDKISLSVDTETVSVKDITQDNIKSKVAGKRKNNLESLLREEAGVSGYRVDVTSPVIVLDQWMPFFQKNIDLKTSTM